MSFTSAKDASSFFTDYCGFARPPLVNPADFFMDVIAGKYPRHGGGQGHHDPSSSSDPPFVPEDLVWIWEEHQEIARLETAREEHHSPCSGGGGGGTTTLTLHSAAQTLPRTFARVSWACSAASITCGSGNP